MRVRRWPAAVLLCLVLPSCFTLHLWGFTFEDDDPITGEEGTGLEYDLETKWSWSLFGQRVLFTPLTLALDCLTCPIQVWLFGDDDDDC